MTKVTPRNDQLREKVLKMGKDPDLVYRRLNFLHGVPREYEWTGPDTTLRQYGGIGIQRLTFQDWLETARTEEERGTGHLMAAAKGNVPRPRQRGGCECGVCLATAEREWS